MIRHHSHIGTAAWTDLLRMLKDAQISELRGAPKLKAIGKKRYWYDQYRIGSDVVDRYIGEDSKDLRDRLARLKELALERKEKERERSRLMRVLRAEGYLMADAQTGQVLSAMERAGIFRLGGTLLGTQAFRLYEGELGFKIDFGSSAVTDDIDMASCERLSIVLEDVVEEPLSKAFSQLKFAPVPSLEKVNIWRWQQTDRTTLVEFLTPSFDEKEGIRDLPALGISAQSLRHLNFLIADPIQVPLLYRSGALVQIPRPERFAVHKLIVAGRRRSDPSRLKARKDRAQADLLIEVLSEERPTELAEAYEDAMERGPAWRNRISASLSLIPQARKRIDDIT
ncbi:nucleotidyltransferase family protein [Roseicyclus marinus]|uniref:nucleotidyltransferase family protein n=1 Tax=Roseicyclus marinus TaxID=2161673 RepID=UPI00240F84D5|nr:GSU2403 family nucleotidyltransferase fold protein [Roseicyclus marinus]MDG3043121.1 GSU2403 family nucleotidyltransferase fold protein [Roseicyclus marinus]